MATAKKPAAKKTAAAKPAPSKPSAEKRILEALALLGSVVQFPSEEQAAQFGYLVTGIKPDGAIWGDKTEDGQSPAKAVVTSSSEH